MRMPRDIDGDALAAFLRRYGYEITRQRGSHIRLTTQANGEHHLTIPLHRPLRVGTLAGILGEVAVHVGIDRVHARVGEEEATVAEHGLREYLESAGLAPGRPLVNADFDLSSVGQIGDLPEGGGYWFHGLGCEIKVPGH